MELGNYQHSVLHIVVSLIAKWSNSHPITMQLYIVLSGSEESLMRSEKLTLMINRVISS